MLQPADHWYLENVNLFKFLCPMKIPAVPDGNGQDIAQTYKKGDFIYHANEPAKQVYLLEKGKVKISSYSDSGKEIIKAILQPGEIFGELVILGAERRMNFATAIDPVVQVYAMDLSMLQGLMLKNADFSLRITKLISLRLKETERRLESLVFKDARARIVEYLKELANEYGKPIGDEILIQNFLTHKDIASLTATSRQTVTSILNDLRDQNLIYFDRKRLLIRDMDKLA